MVYEAVYKNVSAQFTQRQFADEAINSQTMAGLLFS